jgi:predicted ATP-dependent serine protease
MGTEEKAERFIGRAVLAGANRELVYDLRRPNSFLLPRDADKIRNIILMGEVDVLYIDAIYSHFQHQDGQNEAIRARTALAPLAEIAHETGCTIFGVFHANKAGAYLGSVEMENVARCLLEAKRPPKGEHLSVRVAKTNYPNPRKLLRLLGKEVTMTIGDDTQYEVTEDGERVPMTIVVPTRIDDIEDTDEELPATWDDIPDIKPTAESAIWGLLAENPSLSNAELVEKSGYSLDTVKKNAAEFRKVH